MTAPGSGTAAPAAEVARLPEAASVSAPSSTATEPKPRLRPWHLSFRAKTVIGIALIEFLLLGLLVASSLNFLARAQLDGLAARAQDVATNFAVLARDAVLSEDLASLDTFADGVLANQDVAYLRIIGFGTTLLERGDPTAIRRDFSADRPGAEPSDGVFDATAPVLVGGDEFGRIEVGYRSGAGAGMLQAARNRLLIIAAAEILLVALFSILLGTYLTRALERLHDAAETIITGGPGVTVPVTGNDEVAATARAFNRMSGQLAASYAALENARGAAEQAAAEAHAASAEAKRATAAKSRFLAHMSHELRTPLNAVIGTLDLTRDWELPEEQSRQLAAADQAARSLVELISDLLDLSKAESGELTLNEKPADLADVVRVAADVVRPIAHVKGYDLTVSVDDRLPTLAMVDPLRLRQVLVNLLGNAVKYTDAGEVRVAATTQCPSQPCQRVRFTVSDTGTGIPPDRIATLFDEFSQVADKEGRHRGGTGLGLAISQRIVGLMGGEIRVESTPGEGSRFSFEFTVQAPSTLAEVAPPRPLRKPLPLPACRTPHPDIDQTSGGEAGAVSAPASSAATGADLASDAKATLPVLVVDDVPTNTAIARAMLKRAGYTVLTAADGAKALDAVCSGQLGAILMDVDMPVMDGIEAARRVRALAGPTARVPIIAMTAHALEEERQRCLAAGMDDFVTKPFTRETLVGAVDRWHGAESPTDGTA
jgi:signal transduction histidine kinase/ActR/RegA family two-component response regulator